MNKYKKKMDMPTKKYLHFDPIRDYKTVKKYVENPQKVSKHSFFPLIHYTKSFDKYNRTLEHKGRPIKSKKRNIMYAAHIDRYIYAYYGKKLNVCYNRWTLSNHIDDCSIAYRNNKKTKCNIDFSAEVISFIVSHRQCYVLIADYKNFFESLDHAYLKARFKEVLLVNSIPSDWYNIFKSITKYAYVEKELLNHTLGSDKEIKKKKGLSYFKTCKDFRDFKNEYGVLINSKRYGIPQGTSVSAILANVYMTVIDKEISELAAHYGGLYRRYSDDFILIVPHHLVDSIESFERLVQELEQQIIVPTKLSLQADKTRIYMYKEGNLLNKNKTNVRLDYLGFVFDGKNVIMRQRSPNKFYRNANILLNKARRVCHKKRLKKLPYRKRLYTLYTDRGKHSGLYGNFITYACKSQKKFDSICPHTNNLMRNQIKNRNKKIDNQIRS